MRKISSFIYLSFLVLILLVSCMKPSSDWVKYYDDNDGNIFSYRKEIIEKDRERYIVQIWVKEVFSNKYKEKIIQYRANLGMSAEGYDKLSYENDLYEIDCTKQGLRLLSTAEYDTNNNILSSAGMEASKDWWRHISHDSKEEILLKKVCPNQ